MLILACGTLRGGDDAAGLLVGQRLGEWGFEVEAFQGDGLDLLERFGTNREVYLIAAVVTGGRPGTTHVWDEADHAVDPKVLRCSTHTFGIPQAVGMGRWLGRLPAKFRIHGIEGSQFIPDSPPCPAVLLAVDSVAGFMAIELSDRLYPS